MVAVVPLGTAGVPDRFVAVPEIEPEIVLEKTCVPVKVCPASVRASVALVVGKVITAEPDPVKVISAPVIVIARGVIPPAIE